MIKEITAHYPDTDTMTKFANGLSDGEGFIHWSPTPSEKNYKVRWFIDGKEYFLEKKHFGTTEWTDTSDNTVNLIFWTTLDKYFNEVLGIDLP